MSILHTSDTILMWTYSLLPTAGTVAAGSRAGGQVSLVIPVLDAGLGSMEETQEY